jgi:hypothetical protein
MNHSLLRSQVVTSRSASTLDESSHLRRSSIALIDKSHVLLVDSRECLVLSRQKLARSARLLRGTEQLLPLHRRGARASRRERVIGPVHRLP